MWCFALCNGQAFFLNVLNIYIEQSDKNAVFEVYKISEQQ